MPNLADLIHEDISGKTVLLRTNLNVPLELVSEGGGYRVTDDGRIEAAVPTIKALMRAGATVIVTAHLGRPKGEPKPEFSLQPVVQRMSELLGTEVEFATDTVGESARQAIATTQERTLLDQTGHVVLLENVRFNPDETSKDDAERDRLADKLAAFADYFVGDAFGDSHRKHASVYDVALKLPAYAGLLVEKEVSELQHVVGDVKRPYVVIMGGSKISDKLAIIETLLPHVDRLLIGGGMGYTFLAAQGYEIGKSLCEPDFIPACKQLLEHKNAHGENKIVVPVDAVCAVDFNNNASRTTVEFPLINEVIDEFSDSATSENEEKIGVPADQMGLDIGSATVELFAKSIRNARTIFWNGPMGVFEMSNFAHGTHAVANAIVESSAYSVVGGGDSAAAVRALGITEAGFDHISTGGGASLEFVEGKKLPGLIVLGY